jgi:hypothetical protein
MSNVDEMVQGIKRAKQKLGAEAAPTSASGRVEGGWAGKVKPLFMFHEWGVKRSHTDAK